MVLAVTMAMVIATAMRGLNIGNATHGIGSDNGDGNGCYCVVLIMAIASTSGVKS